MKKLFVSFLLLLTLALCLPLSLPVSAAGIRPELHGSGDMEAGW